MHGRSMIPFTLPSFTHSHLALFIGMTLIMPEVPPTQKSGKFGKINQWETYKVNSKKRMAFPALGLLGLCCCS